MLSSNKIRTIIGFIALAVLSFIDQQYFYEPLSASAVNPIFRQAMHIIILLAFIPVGYWAFYRHSFNGLKKLWLGVYSTISGIIIFVGLIQFQVNCFSEIFLDFISKIRLFAETPLLFVIMLFISQILLNDRKVVAEKA